MRECVRCQQEFERTERAAECELLKFQAEKAERDRPIELAKIEAGRAKDRGRQRNTVGAFKDKRGAGIRVIDSKKRD